MPKYKVQYTYERWYNVIIEADSREEAERKFHEGDFENEQLYGGELQDNYDITEEN